MKSTQVRPKLSLDDTISTAAADSIENNYSKITVWAEVQGAFKHCYQDQTVLTFPYRVVPGILVCVAANGGLEALSLPST